MVESTPYNRHSACQICDDAIVNAKANTSATLRSRGGAHDEHPLRIALLGYRSAPHSGGQGIYLKYLSRSLAKLGHQVTVISGPPYPELDDSVALIELPSLDLYQHGLRSVTPGQLLNRLNRIEWFSKLTGGFAEPWLFGERFTRWYACLLYTSPSPRDS